MIIVAAACLGLTGSRNVKRETMAYIWILGSVLGSSPFPPRLKFLRPRFNERAVGKDRLNPERYIGRGNIVLGGKHDQQAPYPAVALKYTKFTAWGPAETKNDCIGEP